MAITDDSRVVDRASAESEPALQEEHCTPGERRGLLLVGIYKFFEAAFFIAVGTGALHLIHKDIGDVVMRLVDSLPVDPEGRLVSFLMDKADLINAHDLRRIGAGALLYAATRVVEGTGLLLRKTWAEYFTVVLTTLGLPVEIYELVRRAHWLKFAALVLNLVILFYLLWVLKRQREPSTRCVQD